MHSAVPALLLLVALAGCATPVAEVAPAAVVPEADGAEPRLIEWTRWFRAGVSPGAASRDPGESPLVTIDGARDRVTVTVTWEPSTPLADTMQLYVDVDGEEALSKQGPSPLVHVFEPGELAGSSLETSVYPGTPGLVVDQEVHIAILVERLREDG